MVIGKHVLVDCNEFQVGNNCHVGNNSSIIGNIKLGNEVFVHENVLIRSFRYQISIGDRTTINRNTIIESQCTIGAKCSIAPNVVIVGANHIFADTTRSIKEQGSSSKGIIIADDVWIGSNSTILDGVHIGKGSIVAAGAVVNRDIPPMCIAAGVPAKIIKKRLDVQH